MTCFFQRCFVFLLLAMVGGASPFLFSLSPRLLVQIGPECDFTPNDLQKHMDVMLVAGDEQTMEATINQLDPIISNHVTVLAGEVNDINWFAERVCYDYIVLHEPLPEALVTLASTIASVPVTDSALPRTDPQIIGSFYALMQKVHDLFERRNLRHWAICGTLLGMVRHNGMIPWDDDIDIAIMASDLPLFLDLEKELSVLGLQICYHEKLDIFKIFPAEGTSIPISGGSGYYPWKYPFIDIFLFAEANGTITYRSEISQKEWPKEYFFPEEISLIELPFGPMKLPAPQGYLAYLNRSYGKDWNTVAYVQYNHLHESFMRRIKVCLLNRAPAEYVLP